MASDGKVQWALSVLSVLSPERQMTREQVAAYAMALGDMTDEQLDYAVKRAVRECRFYPKPAELRDFAGVNAKPKPDVSGALDRIRALVTYYNGEQMPSVERVRDALGDVIANAYGYVGPQRLEAVVLGGSGVGVDIAAREFATALSDAQASGQDIALPPLTAMPQLSNASQSLFLDGQPQRIGTHIAGLLPFVSKRLSGSSDA